LEFSTTEVTESVWGLSFFNAANKSYDNENFNFSCSIAANILKIEFAEQQFMYFEKIN